MTIEAISQIKEFQGYHGDMYLIIFHVGTASPSSLNLVLLPLKAITAI